MVWAQVAALQNIHRNANRERAAKELAESPKTIANGNGRDHELLRALKPADYDALFYDGEADAHRVARTSVIYLCTLHVHLGLTFDAFLFLFTTIEIWYLTHYLCVASLLSCSLNPFLSLSLWTSSISLCFF